MGCQHKVLLKILTSSINIAFLYVCVFGGEGWGGGAYRSCQHNKDTKSICQRTDLVCTCMLKYVSQTGMEGNYMNHYHQSCSYISFQDSFPQISNGNFRFNGVLQADFDSFLQSLTDFRR